MSVRVEKPRVGCGRCGETGKTCFKHPWQAQEVSKQKTGMVMRAYFCNFCGYYHFTKQDRIR